MYTAIPRDLAMLLCFCLQPQELFHDHIQPFYIPASSYFSLRTFKMLLKFLSLALLATPIIADGAAVADAMNDINSLTLQVNSTVRSWSGDALGALPIIIESTQLLSAINNGTTTAEQSNNLTFAEALNVATVTITLVSNVLSTLDTIEAAKPKFANLLLGPEILLSLVLQKDATDKFQTAVVAKIPENLQSVAAVLVAPIDPAFSAAISDFEWVL